MAYITSKYATHVYAWCFLPNPPGIARLLVKEYAFTLRSMSHDHYIVASVFLFKDFSY